MVVRKIKNINDIYNLSGGYFEQNVWNLKEYPLKDIKEMFKTTRISTTLINLEHINDKNFIKEIKFFIRFLLEKSGYCKSTILQYIRALRKYVLFEKEVGCNTKSFSKIEKDCLDQYNKYLKQQNIEQFVIIRKKYKRENIYLVIIKRIKKYFIEKYDDRDFFDKELWYINQLNISPSRIDKSKAPKYFNFKGIKNKNNLKLLKKYFRNLIFSTKNTVSTMRGKLSNLKKFIVFLDNKKLIELNRQIILSYIDYLNEKDIENLTFNSHLLNLRKFLNYLVIQAKIKDNYLFSADMKKVSRDHVDKTIDTYVINQIISKLNLIPLQFQCMYLLLLTVGMRNSELCIIKIDSFYRNKDVYYLKYYQTKMKKEVTNPIPEGLFYLLEKQNNEVKNKYKAESKYLFPSTQNKAYNSGVFTDKFNQYMKKLNIKNEDGSKYHFRTHDYRHTLATKLTEFEVDFDIIQGTLHHDSPEMSLSYIDLQNKRKINNYKKFINVNGQKQNIFLKEKTNELAEIKWLNEKINAQKLPNGVCALPTAAGDCPHANSCLTCSYFCTSKDYLNIHKQQLQDTELFLEKAKSNNWVRQIETNKSVKKNLIKIISVLENEGVNIESTKKE